MPKIHDQQQTASLHAGVGGAMSNDEGALELYPSDPKVSEPEDSAHATAGIFLSIPTTKVPTTKYEVTE